LKLKYDEPLSNFAFNFKLRLYTAVARVIQREAPAVLCLQEDLVGRGTLTPG